MGDITRSTNASRTERIQHIRSALRAQKSKTNPYAPPRSAEISRPARLASRDVPPARLDRVEAAREKVKDPGYVEAHFGAAMNILISQDL